MKRGTPIFHRLFGWLVRGLVKPKVLPEGFNLPEGKRVCYVLESDILSNRLILESFCQQHGWPSACHHTGEDAHPYPMIAIQEMKGLVFRHSDPRSHTKQLGELLAWTDDHPDEDLVLMPVSIFLGRATDSDSGFFKILFTENWPITGRIRRFFSMLMNGRDSIIQLSAPLSLEEIAEEKIGRDRLIRKISRVLRVHFRRTRTTILGPDLSHRRTLVDTLLKTAVVRDAIQSEARKKKITPKKATKQARKYAREIAADYSYTTVRIASRMLVWFWNKIYNGVKVRHQHNLDDIPKGSELIYVPCHRSHIDYLLVSWLVFMQGRVVPHIAAGVNLNLPVIGSLLRKGGAFFIRRSFRSNVLYSVIFNEYVDMIFRKGVSMEYFIEGGRSRTGRLRDPSMGMLSMTVRSYLKHQQRPVKFIPIYLGYEKLVEGSSYLKELSGGKKKSESVAGVFRSLKILRQEYGQVHVSYGKPIDLNEHLDTHQPDWQNSLDPEASKPAWLTRVVESLANEIMLSINRTAHVNAINLIALALLSSPRNALSEDDLIAQMDLLRAVIKNSASSPETTITDMPAAEIIRYAENLKAVSRREHALGDVIFCTEIQSFSLTYFRNNALHLIVAHSWVACMFRNNPDFSRERMKKMADAVFPYIKRELFVDTEIDDFSDACDSAIASLVDLGLLNTEPESDIIERNRGETAEAMQLKLLSDTVFLSLERYFMTVAILVKNGSGKLSTRQLENLCQLCAERLSIMYSKSSPDFFDRSLFKGFIRRMRRNDILGTSEEGKLTFDHRLEDVIEDAKGILSKLVRHTILQISYVPEDKEEEAVEETDVGLESADLVRSGLGEDVTTQTPDTNKTI